MATVLEIPATTSPPRPAAAPTAKPVSGWLVSPLFDLIFMANLGWPVVVLLALQNLPWISEPLSFTQIYFLSTPHRWITLMLVFGDRDRFWKEPGALASSASVSSCSALPSLRSATTGPALKIR